ncbi:MAG: CoB--CoM heterodisulfide reductase iron-sulfur subunit A family protein [Deltaproteobacteria bacterium]|nr:MAG: CoB--CoM heterodisulfide reductase iron-sulfur subunit A family protein [Deltaproteobacteria bacterium]
MSGKLPLLVIGGGIAGMTAAIEAAEAGAEVVLVESLPYLGGRVVRNHLYFPKLCPPLCGLEINLQRLTRNERIRVFTSTRIVGAERTGSKWAVELETAPQWINEKCTACGECAKVCTTEVSDPFNLEMNKVKAVRLPHPAAWPHRYVLDSDACTPDELQAIAEACPVGAVDLDASASRHTIEAGAIIVATGWQPYSPSRLDNLGAGNIADVITNVQMERMAAEDGPTGGRIQRISDARQPRKVAFVQCAGSRDVNHLPYCSGVCCLASLKQALYVKEQIPDCQVDIFYIDRRALGRNEDVLRRVEGLEGVRLIKGKAGKIQSDGNEIVLRLEDVESGRMLEARADLVVLATGMVPNLASEKLPIPVAVDEDGFAVDDPQQAIFAAGVARRPEEVAATTRDATGAAAKAMAAMRRA